MEEHRGSRGGNRREQRSAARGSLNWLPLCWPELPSMLLLLPVPSWTCAHEFRQMHCSRFRYQSDLKSRALVSGVGTANEDDLDSSKTMPWISCLCQVNVKLKASVLTQLLQKISRPSLHLWTEKELRRRSMWRRSRDQFEGASASQNTRQE